MRGSGKGGESNGGERAAGWVTKTGVSEMLRDHSLTVRKTAEGRNGCEENGSGEEAM